MITGLLEERPLPVVLQQLYSLRFTGELALNTRAGLIQVYLREGYPVYVNLSESGDLLGRIMVEMRVLTEASVRRALAAQAGEGVRFGDVLLQLALCDEGQLKQALRAQVRRKLHRLFALPGGGYAAIPGEHQRGLQGGESMRVHPYRVIYHGVRSLSPERVKALLRPLAGQAFRLPPEGGPDLAGRFSFGAEEAHVLQLLRRGFWTLHEITEAAGLEGGLLAAVLSTLLATEQLEVGAEGSQPQARDRITDLPPAPAAQHPALAPTVPAMPAMPALGPERGPPLVLELGPPLPVAGSPPAAAPGPPVIELAPPAIELAPPTIELAPPAARPSAPPRAAAPAPGSVREDGPPLALELERGPVTSGATGTSGTLPRLPAPSRSAASSTSLPRSSASGPPPATQTFAAPRELAPGPTSAASLARAGGEVSTTPARSITQDLPVVTGRTLSGGTPGPTSSTSASSSRLSTGASQPSLPAQGRAPVPSRPAQRPVSFEEMALLRAEIENKSKVIEDETLFAVLGLSQEADVAEVKAAYLQAAKRFHPDRVVAMGLQALREQAERVFRRVNEAHQVLTDPERREEYVAELRLKDASGDKLLKEKALAVQAVNAELAFSRGAVFLRKRDYAAAAREFDEAVRLNPNEGEHVGYAAWARYCAGKTPAPDASKEMIRAIRMAPKCGRLHYFLGVLYKQDGAEDRAYQSFKKAYELDGRIDEAQSEVRLLDARRGKRGAPRPVSADSSKSRGASSESQKSDKGHEKKRGLLDMLRPGTKK